MFVVRLNSLQDVTRLFLVIVVPAQELLIQGALSMPENLASFSVQ